MANVDESGNDYLDKNDYDYDDNDNDYVHGGNNYDYAGENTVLATILKFDPDSDSWTEVGNMTRARYAHAASVVNVEDVEKFCV